VPITISIMVQGMAFLSKKGFNPHNNTNRKLVWEAQENSKREKERIQQRQKQLKKEQEDEDLEIVMKGEIGGSQAQLRFMYDAPPGMSGSEKNKGGNNDKDDCKDDDDKPYSSKNEDKGNKQPDSSLAELTKVKPGDDAAAMEFRRMLAAASASPGDGKLGSAPVELDSGSVNDGNGTTKSFKFTPSLQGRMELRDNGNKDGGGDGVPVKNDSRANSNANSSKVSALVDNRSALEKEVGRKNRSKNLSYQQQIERFPQLKHAPMAAKPKDSDGGTDAAAPTMVNFKPLGVQILHVRCMSCGIWGHARGDRECAKSGWNPFSLPSSSSATDQQQGSSSTIISGGVGSSGIKHTSVEKKKSNITESSSNDHHRRHLHPKEKNHHESSDSSRDGHRRRHHRRRDDNHSDDSSREDRSSRRHRSRRRHDDKDRYKNNDGGPSSEDRSKLKIRKDHDFYDESDDSDDERRCQKQGSERRRDHKSSKKKRSKDRNELFKKKKKKRRHDSP